MLSWTSPVDVSIGEDLIRLVTTQQSSSTRRWGRKSCFTVHSLGLTRARGYFTHRQLKGETEKKTRNADCGTSLT